MINNNASSLSVQLTQDISLMVEHYCNDLQEKLIHTLRRGDVCFPPSLSRVLKSLLLHHYPTLKSGDRFPEYSLPITQENTGYKVHEHNGPHRVIEDSSTKLIHQFSLVRESGLQNRQVTHEDITYNSFSRTGTLQKHMQVLLSDLERDSYLDKQQGLITDLEQEELTLITNIHDRSETVHTDIESVYKTDAIRAYEKKTMKNLIETLFPQKEHHTYLLNLLTYSPASRFKWLEYQQFPECGIQFRKDIESNAYTYVQPEIAILETTKGFLDKFSSQSVLGVDFSSITNIPPLEVESIHQFAHRLLPEITHNLGFLKEHQGAITSSPRYHTSHPYTQSGFNLEKQLDDLYIGVDKLTNYFA